jgi:3-hydroxyacyl-[acyl-carrier-protein] dehydratase
MTLDKDQIKKIIPYQEPFLFIDGIEEITENSISGFYKTSKDDYYFRGHLVDFPIMPGVLVIEGIAQTATLLLRQKLGKVHLKKHALAYQVKGVFFYKPIFPGDKIIYQVKLVSIYEERIANFKGEAFVGEELKCEVRFSCVIVDKKEFQKKYVKE